MKQVRTLRGVATGSEKKYILQNDLRNVGWRVTKFYLWPNNMDANPYCWGKLWIGDDQGGSLGFSDAADNRAIAWGAAGGGQVAPATNPATRWSIIDPDHIITNTLMIHSGTAESIAYLVELEMTALTDDQQVMALIKERSQDDPTG